MSKEITQLKESKLYEIYQKRERLLKECSLLEHELDENRLERMEEINSLRVELKEQISKIEEKIQNTKLEHKKQRYDLCQKIGHAYYTVNDIVEYNGEHSSRYGQGCVVKYNSVCKFCGDETEGSYSTYSKCVKFSESTNLLDEQINLEKIQKEELEKIYEELEKIKNKNLELQIELEKMCKLLGHLIPPCESPFRNDEEVCKCCGKSISYL